ncbi:MAG: uracil-DNA glycosylase family protein [Sphingomicrobium sp.]
MGGDLQNIDAAEAASALAWWLEAGVDLAVQEEPRDWLKAPAPIAPVATAVEAKLATPAQSALVLPDSLDLFRDWLRDAPALPLAHSGGRRILPVGKENAPVMLLTETPGTEGAADGQPIGGDPWLLAKRMLAAIGIAPEDAYCASFACFHAVGGGLKGADLDACTDIARKHIALAKPQRLLLLGDVPAKALLGKPLAAARGHVHRVEGTRTIATFHPSLMMKYPSNKESAWSDLLLLMEENS